MKSLFFKLTANLLAIMASFFLVKGNVGLTPKSIVEISLTKYGGNLDVMKTLCSQKSDTLTGLILILLSFIAQINASMVNFAIPNNYGKYLAVRNSIVLSVAIFIVSLILNDFYKRRLFKKASELIKKNKA